MNFEEFKQQVMEGYICFANIYSSPLITRRIN